MPRFIALFPDQVEVAAGALIKLHERYQNLDGFEQALEDHTRRDALQGLQAVLLAAASGTPHGTQAVKLILAVLFRWVVACCLLDRDLRVGRLPGPLHKTRRGVLAVVLSSNAASSKLQPAICAHAGSQRPARPTRLALPLRACRPPAGALPNCSSCTLHGALGGCVGQPPCAATDCTYRGYSKPVAATLQVPSGDHCRAQHAQPLWQAHSRAAPQQPSLRLIVCCWLGLALTHTCMSVMLPCTHHPQAPAPGRGRGPFN